MPKRSRPTKRSSSPLGLALLAVGLVLIVALLWVSAQAPRESAQQKALATLTPIPGLKATLTALPKASPMPDEEARPYVAVRALVEQCDQYAESRKVAILQQIDFVLNPATVPTDLLAMYGDAWPGKMIFGSAYFTSLEWKTRGRDKGSCLYAIGVQFNDLLRSLGEKPFAEFDE